MLASSLIPGNENAVYRVINGLSRLGAHVVHKGNALVHVSGHAAAGELHYCYNIVKPRNVMPVHGEWRHLRANARHRRRARACPSERVVLAEDGVGGRPRRRRRHDRRRGARAASSTSTASAVGDVTETSLKDRRILGEEGFISVLVVVDSTDGKVVGGPEIHARGFAEDESVFDEVRPQVAAALEDALREGTDRHLRAAAASCGARSAAGSATPTAAVR